MPCARCNGERGDVTRDALEPLRRGRLPDRLVEQLADAIERHEFRRGDRLPTIADMSLRFGVSHATVRLALAQLELMRLVEVRHGLGIFVIAA
jgi:GntR family transcriptional repressor for pyruvate dehydrogenase complex